AALCLPVLVAARSGRRGELLSFPTRRSSDLLHPLLAEVRPRHKVFDIACATTQRDAVLLVWPFLAKQPVPPILVGVINPTSFAFAYIFDDPRPIGMFGFVVYAGEQLFHILLGVLDVFVARVGLPEFID